LTKIVTVTADNWTSFEQRLSLPRYLVDAALLELDPEVELALAEWEAEDEAELAELAAKHSHNPEYDSAGFWQTGEEEYRTRAKHARSAPRGSGHSGRRCGAKGHATGAHRNALSIMGATAAARMAARRSAAARAAWARAPAPDLTTKASYQAT
jgi:hypothetical protein